VKIGKSATDTLEMLREAFVTHSLSRTEVFECHSRLKAGRVSVDDVQLSGRPRNNKATEYVEKIRELNHEDDRGTIHMLADTVGISYGFGQERLTENLNMRRIVAKFVPRLLINDQ
jgi:uncharacterized protein related to proFAR isomerase